MQSPIPSTLHREHIFFFNAGEGSGLGDWQFRGKRIAAAVMEDLFLQHGLANATHVLLTGDSAGGVGAMNNADWIGGMLKYAPIPGQLLLQHLDP